MDAATCDQDYSGPISTWSSADIVAAAGPRIPVAASEQHHYRTAWVMIHLPFAAPTNQDLDKAVAILQQHELDWRHSTLGRGTMDNSLFGTCARARVYGCGVNPLGSMRVVSGVPAIGTSMLVSVDNPLKTQRVGSTAYLVLTGNRNAEVRAWADSARPYLRAGTERRELVPAEEFDALFYVHRVTPPSYDIR